jgi:hypothetical protein
MTHGFCPFMSVMEMAAQWRDASAKSRHPLLDFCVVPGGRLANVARM